MQPASEASRQILVVAGSGRSGTSLFTGLTSRLGLHVPKPEVKSNRSNPTGRITAWKSILNTLAIAYGDRLNIN